MSDDEKRVLSEFGVDEPERLLEALEDGGEAEDVWHILERNANRIVRLGRAGVRRTRRTLRARQGASGEKEKMTEVKKEEEEDEDGAEVTEAEKAEGAFRSQLVQILYALAEWTDH